MSKKLLKSLFKLSYSLFTKIKVPYPSKSLLIVRLDAVGDYVLFRNSIQRIKNAPKYKHYNFYLLGNTRFEGLATNFDRNYFKECFWIDPEILKNAKNKERLLLLVKLKLHAFDIIINPVHSRLAFIDKFISEIGGKLKIASKGDNVNWPSSDFVEMSNKYYNKLIDVPGPSCFEFYRNKKFVENLLEEKQQSFDLCIPIQTYQSPNENLCIKVVIVPGASNPLRCWDVNNFREVIETLTVFFEKNIMFTITGSTSEQYIGNSIKNNLAPEMLVENKAGSTELAELVQLINDADLLISNETSTVHIAAAVNTPVICISKPNLYGRFHPYPKEMGKPVDTIYPQAFQDFKKGAENNISFSEVEMDINTVTVESVVTAAKFLLSTHKKIN